MKEDRFLRLYGKIIDKKLQEVNDYTLKAKTGLETLKQNYDYTSIHYIIDNLIEQVDGEFAKMKELILKEVKYNNQKSLIKINDYKKHSIEFINDLCVQGEKKAVLLSKIEKDFLKLKSGIELLAKQSNNKVRPVLNYIIQKTVIDIEKIKSEEAKKIESLLLINKEKINDDVNNQITNAINLINNRCQETVAEIRLLKKEMKEITKQGKARLSSLKKVFPSVATQITKIMMENPIRSENNEEMKSGGSFFKDVVERGRYVYVNNNKIFEEINALVKEKNIEVRAEKNPHLKEDGMALLRSLFSKNGGTVPHDKILEELVMKCNQAGYESALFCKLHEFEIVNPQDQKSILLKDLFLDQESEEMIFLKEERKLSLQSISENHIECLCEGTFIIRSQKQSNNQAEWKNIELPCIEIPYSYTFDIKFNNDEKVTNSLKNIEINLSQELSDEKGDEGLLLIIKKIIDGLLELLNKIFHPYSKEEDSHIRKESIENLPPEEYLTESRVSACNSHAAVVS